MPKRDYSRGANRSSGSSRQTIVYLDAGAMAEWWEKNTRRQFKKAIGMKVLRKKAEAGDRNAQMKLAFMSAKLSERCEKVNKTRAILAGKPNFIKPADKARRITRVDPDTGISHTLDIVFPGHDTFNKVLNAIIKGDFAAKGKRVKDVCPSLTDSQIEFLKTGRWRDDNGSVSDSL